MTDTPTAGVSEQAYNAQEGIRQSRLKLMAISPAHYRAACDAPEERPTRAQVIGTVTHQVILQGKHDYVVRPDGMKFTTKDGMAWRDAQTKTIIDGDEFDTIRGMRESVLRHPIARSILEREGENEVAIYRKDSETGLMLKARADRVTTDDNNYIVIPDLKTTQYGCASKEAFAKEIYNWGYAQQAWWYLTLFGATSFIFIVVEKEAPYACAVYTLDRDAIEYGGRKCREYLRQVKSCTDSGIWPAYSAGMEWISIPEWAARKEL